MSTSNVILTDCLEEARTIINDLARFVGYEQLTCLSLQDLIEHLYMIRAYIIDPIEPEPEILPDDDDYIDPLIDEELDYDDEGEEEDSGIVD